MISFEKLLIATTNINKLAEFQSLLAGSPCQIVAPESILAILPEVDETGETLSQNARLKATAWAKAAACWTLADDTGLEVDALDGRPGVHSARFAGQNAKMSDNRQKLLFQLESLGATSRTATFKCVLALANPQGIILSEVSGHCRGEILRTPACDGGFGYDSLFYVPEAKKTLAEMDSAESEQYSHRARAVHMLKREVKI